MEGVGVGEIETEAQSQAFNVEVVQLFSTRGSVSGPAAYTIDPSVQTVYSDAGI